MNSGVVSKPLRGPLLPSAMSPVWKIHATLSRLTFERLIWVSGEKRWPVASCP